MPCEDTILSSKYVKIVILSNKNLIFKNLHADLQYVCKMHRYAKFQTDPSYAVG